MGVPDGPSNIFCCHQEENWLASKTTVVNIIFGHLYFRNRLATESSVRQPRITGVTECHRSYLDKLHKCGIYVTL